jgi:hypothetical protein
MLQFRQDRFDEDSILYAMWKNYVWDIVGIRYLLYIAFSSVITAYFSVFNKSDSIYYLILILVLNSVAVIYVMFRSSRIWKIESDDGFSKFI